MSTFTNWNGPQGSDVRAKDMIEFANAYSELVNKLNQHIQQTAADDNVHQVKQYVDNAIATLQAQIPSVTAFITAVAADAKYTTKTEATQFALKSELPNMANYALKSSLSDYLKTSELSSQEIIQDIQEAIQALQDWVNSDSKTIPNLISEHVTGLVKAIEQVQFVWKNFGAFVGGSNDFGVYYILGMLDERAGTAYIRLTNTKSFAAVIHFAITKNTETNEFIDGQLSITTDVDSADLTDVHFLIVSGTDASGRHHSYLAMQAKEWTKLVDESGIINAGVFSAIQFEGAGINFIPVDSEGFVRPNNTTEVLIDVDYYALEDRITAVEHKLDTITSDDGIGTISNWPKYDEDGVATNVPDWAHACDGSDIPDDEEHAAIRAICGAAYPVQDYAIIRIKKVISYD